ncbi:MAG: hypothetical protein HY299_03810 [Verrucomicrobia bacterium]|nr:hypothetical protein [Verrucomicrobiota bacterium]
MHRHKECSRDKWTHNASLRFKAKRRDRQGRSTVTDKAGAVVILGRETPCGVSGAAIALWIDNGLRKERGMTEVMFPVLTMSQLPFRQHCAMRTIGVRELARETR